MKRSTSQRLDLAQTLLYSAAMELKALKYERLQEDDVRTTTEESEQRIDDIVHALNTAKVHVLSRESRTRTGVIARLFQR